MKRVAQLTLVVALVASSLWGQETPAGTAGERGMALRPLSRRLTPAPNTLTWSGCGIAKIDGILSPGEWTGAMSQVISVSTPAGTVNATLYIMNDNYNLYVALKYPETAPNPGSLGVEFDNDDDGTPYEEGDDALVANNQIGFFDDFRTACGPDICGPQDTTHGGTTDGESAYLNDGTNSVYEIAHPLNSRDPHDFGLFATQRVGFFILLRIIGGGGTIHDTYYPGPAIYDHISIQQCPPPVLSGCGTPVLDGIVGSTEWASAGQFRLTVGTPNHRSTPGTLYLMNDAFNLYVALAFDQPAAPPPPSGMSVALFPTGGSAGIDSLSFDPTVGFSDRVNPRFDLLRNVPDTTLGGTADGAAAFANNGIQSAYEFSHPLNTGDAWDVALAYGDTIPYFISVTTGGTFSGFGVAGQWLICTPGPTQSVQDLGQQVDRLEASRALSSNNADTLRKDLRKASGNLQSDKTKQAANDLGNFITDVTKMMRKGELADRFGQPLIAAANIAISQL